MVIAHVCTQGICDELDLMLRLAIHRAFCGFCVLGMTVENLIEVFARMNLRKDDDLFLGKLLGELCVVMDDIGGMPIRFGLI